MATRERDYLASRAVQEAKKARFAMLEAYDFEAALHHDQLAIRYFQLTDILERFG
ncbi:hypothetical protein BV96_01242 [Sphingomonas paucimobilis]|nr:hypothetical protein BV96_01242 [Sphingomonas paucimobilis]